MIDKDNTSRETFLVSILIFNGTENIERLISTLPEKIVPICADLNLTGKIIIRKNNPKLDTASLEKSVRYFNETLEDLTLELVDEGKNSGFGRGHNLNYQRFRSDYLLILNDDLDMPHLDWMRVAVPRMREEKLLAMIGDVSNPDAINPFFANGTFPDQYRNFTLRYAEASILLIRGAAFAEIGMFDETIAWAMGEDSDLSFKAQQAGYYLDWMPMPHRHFRSSSFNSLPQYQKASVLEHNRARLLAKWGNSFDTGAPGKFEVFDVYSDGLGDMFCALLHIRAEYDRLPQSMHKHIVVNVGNEALARVLLPHDAVITSERDINVLRNRLSNNDIASVRSSRTLNYALPYNIHSLVSGALSLPFAEEKTLSEAAEALKNASSQIKIEGEYCVVHLEFEREGHHGRGPSMLLIRNILANISALNCKVVIVGKNTIITSEYFPESVGEIIDLQGKTTLLGLVSIVANAKYLVGIDSFPFHIAQVAKVPSVAFFGSVSPALRVLREDLVWPLSANLDCLGCYHDQIEPGAPFCMRMNEQCTYDISQDRVRNAIRSMANGEPFDWSPSMRQLNKKIARFVEFQKFHPTSREQLHNTIIPNQQVSELIYELTDRISKTYSKHLSGSFVSQLQDENSRMRSQLLQAHTKISSYEAVHSIVPREADKVPSIPGAELIWRRTRCGAHEENGEIVCRSSQSDPQIEFVPLKLHGPRFGVSITVRAHPPSILKLYWRTAKAAYCEENSLAIDANEHSNSRVWWYSGPIDKPIYIRIDPSEGAGNVRMTVSFLGDLDRDAILRSLHGSVPQKGRSAVRKLLNRLPSVR